VNKTTSHIKLSLLSSACNLLSIISHATMATSTPPHAPDLHLFPPKPIKRLSLSTHLANYGCVILSTQIIYQDPPPVLSVDHLVREPKGSGGTVHLKRSDHFAPDGLDFWHWHTETWEMRNLCRQDFFLSDRMEKITNVGNTLFWWYPSYRHFLTINLFTNMLTNSN